MTATVTLRLPDPSFRVWLPGAVDEARAAERAAHHEARRTSHRARAEHGKNDVPRIAPRGAPVLLTPGLNVIDAAHWDGVKDRTDVAEHVGAGRIVVEGGQP